MTAEPQDKQLPDFFDRLCERLAGALARRKEPGSRLHWLINWCRRILQGATFAYVATALVFMALLEWRAERHWLTAFLLYAPPQVFLLPLVLLAPLALLLHPRLLWWHLGLAVFILVGFMDLNWSWSAEAKGRTLTLVTNNLGEAKKFGVIPFIQQEQADIIVLQDAYGRAPEYQAQFTNYSTAAQGQFVILSRWPVKSSGLVPVMAPDNVPLAAWFELDCDGQPLVVYNVHLITPRAQLEGMRGLGFFAALLGRSGRHGSKLRTASDEFWDSQMQLAEKLAVEIRREKRPFLLAGDFNTPSRGVVYHTFAASFADAFARAGSGYGLTFPGVTRNPLSLFGPWLRLDYVFASDAFRVVNCRAEPNRPSQHRAVSAHLEWKNEK